MAPICVKLVKNLFLLVATSLRAIVDGQAFPKRLMEKYAMNPTILTEWFVLKFYAAIAVVILVMYSPMALPHLKEDIV